MSVSHCSSCKQTLCSIVYVFTWLLLIIGLIVFHVGLDELIGPLKDFPDNLRLGFDRVFGFAELESGAKDIEGHSRMALQMCGVSMTQVGNCGGIPNPVPFSRAADTNPKRRAIKRIFEDALVKVQRIANDKYFGTEALQSTANDLNTMLEQINKLEQDPTLNQDGDVPCIGTNKLYCEINRAAADIGSNIGQVTAEVDKFTNHEIVEQYEDMSEYMDYLHGLPYILVISALFFCCLWWFDGRCCASKKGCCALILHLIFWLVFFVIATICCAIGTLVKFYKHEAKIEDLKGEPSLEDLLKHIEKDYPEFWSLVIADLSEGLEKFYYSAVVFEVFCILIVLYGFVICCCKPYGKVKVKPVSD